MCSFPCAVCLLLVFLASGASAQPTFDTWAPLRLDVGVRTEVTVRGTNLSPVRDNIRNSTASLIVQCPTGGPIDPLKVLGCALSNPSLKRSGTVLEFDLLCNQAASIRVCWRTFPAIPMSRDGNRPRPIKIASSSSNSKNNNSSAALIGGLVGGVVGMVVIVLCALWWFRWRYTCRRQHGSTPSKGHLLNSFGDSTTWDSIVRKGPQDFHSAPTKLVPLSSVAVATGARCAWAPLPATVDFRSADVPSSPESVEHAFFEINPCDLARGELIGAGAFGEVYTGLYLGTQVAIKKMNVPKKGRRELFNELQSHARGGGHPHVVTLVGACTKMQDNTCLIVMEYVRGGDLHHFIREHNVGPAGIIRICLQVASAMQHLHRTGIVHRDLKPENILMTTDGKAKITDFGLASIHRFGEIPATTMKTIGGTSPYMAPECIEGMYDASVDVYSFGVMLNELFSGQKPYSDRSFATQFQLMYKVMSEGVRPTLVSPLRCPPQVVDLIQRCWSGQKKGEHGRPTFEDVVWELQQLATLEDEEVEAMCAGAGSGEEEAHSSSSAPARYLPPPAYEEAIQQAPVL